MIDVIDVEALRTHYRRIAGFLDERERRLFAANEALALGRGGVTAVSAASGIARQHDQSRHCRAEGWQQ
jgi:alkylhydroperoxidase family enzyme